MTVYLDCNATTPIEQRVRDLVLHYLDEEMGNAGSRTHEFGMRAKQAVEMARRQVAAVVAAQPEEVVFTSGATESNNLALLGLAAYGEKTGRRHIVTTMIEHKAVLEPCEELERRGFTVTRVPPTASGRVDADAVREAIRPDTLVVSVMHANNETGVIQPVSEIAAALAGHEAFLHVDAAQTFGKEIAALRSARVDLVSVSGHKMYAPKGVGALIARRRGFARVPLAPIIFGGGQERGLRPGTTPVHLVAGLGLAAEIAVEDVGRRRNTVRDFRSRMLDALSPLEPRLHGDQEHCQPHVVNLGFPGLDSEAVMLAWKGVVAVSNGSACTSASYTPSHVLVAMGMDRARIDEAMRISWCHMTPEPDWRDVVRAVEGLR
jgi:cysteine desulfurase